MMNKVDRDGKFRGEITYSVFTDKDTREIVGIALTGKCEELLEGGTWTPWSQYNMEVSGVFYFMKQDGAVNENTVKTLRDVLGWDGNIDTIIAGTWSPPRAQFTVAMSKNNKRIMKYVDDYEYRPMRKAGDAEVAKFKSDIAPKLRAIFGAPAHNAPPKAPVPSKLPPVPSNNGTVKKSPYTCTKDEAWNQFCKIMRDLHPDQATDEWLAKEWTSVFFNLFQGRDETSLTPEDWGKMAVEAKTAIPF